MVSVERLLQARTHLIEKRRNIKVIFDVLLDDFRDAYNDNQEQLRHWDHKLLHLYKLQSALELSYLTDQFLVDVHSN